MMTLTPAYGRDYKSRTAVLKDFDNNVDFKNQSFGYTGGYVSKAQLNPGTRIQFRYDKLRKTFIHEV